MPAPLKPNMKPIPRSAYHFNVRHLAGLAQERFPRCAHAAQENLPFECADSDSIANDESTPSIKADCREREPGSALSRLGLT